jgi:large subunit ribosomal protein L35
MPKLKTHSGASKRFKVTANGRVKHRRAFRNHILTKKPAKRMAQLRAMKTMAKGDERHVRQMLHKTGG